MFAKTTTKSTMMNDEKTSASPKDYRRNPHIRNTPRRSTSRRHISSSRCFSSPRGVSSSQHSSSKCLLVVHLLVVPPEIVGSHKCEPTISGGCCSHEDYLQYLLSVYIKKLVLLPIIVGSASNCCLPWRHFSESVSVRVVRATTTLQVSSYTYRCR